MTPEEAAQAMRHLREKYGADFEIAHGYMDDLLCKVLREQGFGEMVDIYDDQEKWYA